MGTRFDREECFRTMENLASVCVMMIVVVAVLKKVLSPADRLFNFLCRQLFEKINHPLVHLNERTIAMETRAAMHCAHYSDACATMGGNMHKFFLIVCVCHECVERAGKCRRLLCALH